MISLLDIQAIGRRKKGTGFLVPLMSIFDGALIGSAFAQDPDPCPSCQKVNVDSQGDIMGDAVFVVAGATLFGLAVLKAVNNSPREISSGKWKLEIINQKE
jgi:hypothetical protein